MKPITVYIPDDYPLPENFERYEFRPVKAGEAYISGVNNRPVIASCPTVSVSSFIVAVPKPSFPKSVPGFRKGTWFAMDRSGAWYAYLSEPMFGAKTWAGARMLIVESAFLLAHDILSALDVTPENSKFQTTEDG